MKNASNMANIANNHFGNKHRTRRKNKDGYLGGENSRRME